MNEPHRLRLASGREQLGRLLQRAAQLEHLEAVRGRVLANAAKRFNIRRLKAARLNIAANDLGIRGERHPEDIEVAPCPKR